MSDERPILLVDGMNLFIRSYAAYPTMSSHGHQMGGTIGFLKTLSRIIGEFKPRAVHIAWEGGGSSRRRAIYSDYKAHRKPKKLNRFYEDDIPESPENKHHQLITLLAALKCAPVGQLYVDNCEGDDVIAWMCRNHFKDDNKIIVSSDKDMYQLTNDITTMYSLQRKTFITKEQIESDFKVNIENFAIAKALCGDAGDNIKGIKGLGFKKIPKLFPFLGMSAPDITLQKVFDFSYTHQDDSVIYKRVVENQKDILRNFKLVALNDSMISISQISKLENYLSTFKPRVNKMKLMKLMIDEGVNSSFRVDEFLFSMNCLEDLTYGSDE
jgi:DNA polymerase-1